MAWTTKSPIRGNYWVPWGCRALLGSVKYLFAQYAEAGCYCKKKVRWKTLHFKKFSIKQAFFSVKVTNCWFWYLKIFSKFQVLKKGVKWAKIFKKQRKKGQFFLLGCFYAGGKNFTHKKGLLYAKVFEFERFSISFFLQ